MKTKLFRKILLLLAVLLVLVLLAVNYFIRSERTTDAEALAIMGSSFTVDRMRIKDRAVRVLAENTTAADSNLVVFVHGAPGTWDAFKSYMLDQELSQATQMISYDRPGYGGSDARAMVDIRAQAEVLTAIIKKYKKKHVFIVGHSYGATIVGHLATQDSSGVDKAMMIAALIDPAAEPIKWFAYFSKWGWSKALLPAELGIAGAEKFGHVEALQKIETDWQHLSIPIVLIHGTEDGLAPYKETLAFAERQIKSEYLEVITMEGKGHLVVWKDFDRIKTALGQLINGAIN